jgi:hypothetical protein
MRGGMLGVSAGVLLAAATPAAAAAAQDDPAARSAQNAALEGEITPELDAAVTRGLAALAAMQDDDGSWDGGRFGKNVAITSLACLAFMADGNLPGRGAYGERSSVGSISCSTTARRAG